MVNSPVLFITFVRPEYARQSFDAIKIAKPCKLYFYSNKGRTEKPEEIENNNIIRSYINEIDWECELKTYFREEYVDIYTSLRSAIDWVFENEEEAIILEEDCVASNVFFEYCDQLLPKFKNEPKVWMISGNNFTPQANPPGLSYFFSRNMHIFGWAGWADRWNNQDKMMSEYKKLKFSTIVNYYNSIIKALISRIYFNQVYKNFEKFNPWDHIFIYNMVKNGSYSLIPAINLVVDIGINGVHNKNTKITYIPDYIDFNKFELEINNDPEIIPNDKYDNYHFINFKLQLLFKRKLNKFIKFI